MAESETVAWHVKKDNSGVAKCKAKPGNCPLGGANEHFESEEDGLESIYGTAASNNLTKTANGVGRPKPNFDYSEYTMMWYSLEKGATDERKNKGEFSEMYALNVLLSNNELHPGPGSKSFTPTAVQAKNHQYIIDENFEYDEGERRMVYVKPPNGKVVELTPISQENLDDLGEGIKRGARGAGTTFKCQAVKDAAVRVGFTNERIPKAPSESKVDLRAWDENGDERRLSVKSYFGYDPALMSASAQSSELKYSASLPEGMSEDDANNLIAKTEGLSTKEKVKALRRAGVSFDPDSGVPSSEAFRKNLESTDANAQKAYSRALFSVADSETEMSEDLKPAYNRTLGAFAHGMTYSTRQPEHEKVTDFMVIRPNGGASIYNFGSEEETGEHFAKRAKFSEPAKSKAKSGELTFENGKFTMNLNSNVSISQVPRKTVANSG